MRVTATSGTVSVGSVDQTMRARTNCSDRTAPPRWLMGVFTSTVWVWSSADADMNETCSVATVSPDSFSTCTA